jgi:hypothetical protein
LQKRLKFRLYVNSWGQFKIRTALSKLNPQDLGLIELVFGICPDCLKSKEKLTIREASLRVGLTATGAEKKIKKILIQ